MKNMTLVVDLGSKAGSSLTYDNWQQSCANVASCGLEVLLVKPGLAYLMTLDSLADYLGWSSTLVLDASQLHFNKLDQCVIRSTFDGSTCRLSLDDFWLLVSKLTPDMLLLPKQIREIPALASKIKLFCFVESKLEYAHGVYSEERYMTQSRPASKPYYLRMNNTLPIKSERMKQGLDYLATDKPAQDALDGLVYQTDGVLSLLDPSATMNFNPIDAQCGCPTCKQPWSVAYLSHLYTHTPLLCYRLLMMHNVYVMAQH